MPVNKKLARPLIRQAERQGWRVKDLSHGGWMLFSPDGETSVTIHDSASCAHWYANAVALMKRGGFRP